MKTRKSYIDFVKIAAIYMVLFNHTGTRGFMLFTVSQKSILYPVYLSAAVFVKAAVPLFFMSSGALLLGKDEPVSIILRKRFLRFALTLVVFSVIVYGYKVIRGEIPSFSFTGFIKLFYTGTIATPFWYLYAYLSFILMLPFLRILAKNLNSELFRWLLLTYLLMNLLPVIEFLLMHGAAHTSDFSLFISGSVVFYPLVGYYIDRTPVQKKGTFTLLVFASLISVAISCLLTHYKCTVTNLWDSENCQTFLETFIFIPAITVFYGSKVFFARHKIPLRVESFLAYAAGLTFGVYLLENIYRDMTVNVYFGLLPYLGSFVAVSIRTLAACLLGCVVTWVLKHIPYFGILLS